MKFTLLKIGYWTEWLGLAVVNYNTIYDLSLDFVFCSCQVPVILNIMQNTKKEVSQTFKKKKAAVKAVFELKERLKIEIEGKAAAHEVVMKLNASLDKSNLEYFDLLEENLALKKQIIKQTTLLRSSYLFVNI
jgi:hypothetical protein